ASAPASAASGLAGGGWGWCIAGAGEGGATAEAPPPGAGHGGASGALGLDGLSGEREGCIAASAHPRQTAVPTARRTDVARLMGGHKLHGPPCHGNPIVGTCDPNDHGSRSACTPAPPYPRWREGTSVTQLGSWDRLILTLKPEYAEIVRWVDL